MTPDDEAWRDQVKRKLQELLLALASNANVPRERTEQALRDVSRPVRVYLNEVVKE